MNFSSANSNVSKFDFFSHFTLRYLSNNQEVTSSLYSESYHNVAVIFASIPDYLDFYTEAEVHKKGIPTKLN